MGGLPDPVKPTALPPPAPPLPTADIPEQAGEEAKKRRPRGRAETFITGDLIPETKKKTLLG